MNEFRKMDFKPAAALALVALLLAACGGGGPSSPSEAPDSGEPSATATSPSGTGGMGSGLCANLYLPIVQGASWTYSGSGIEEPYEYTTTVSEVRADGFEYTHTFDDLVLTQQWGCTPAGLAALEYGNGPEAIINTSGMTIAYETIDSSGVSLPSDLAVGQSWTQTYTVQGVMEVEGLTMNSTGTVTHTFTAVGEESVTVPAGTFAALRVEGNSLIDLQASMDGGFLLPFTFDSDVVIWWVPNVGMVRSESLVSIEGADAFTDTTVLLSYSIP